MTLFHPQTVATCQQQNSFAQFAANNDKPFAKLLDHKHYTTAQAPPLHPIESKKTKYDHLEWTFNILSSHGRIWIGICSKTNKYYSFGYNGKRYSHDLFPEGMYGGTPFKDGDCVRLKLDCSGTNNMKLSLFHVDPNNINLGCKKSDGASFSIKKTSTYRLMVKVSKTNNNNSKQMPQIEMISFQTQQAQKQQQTKTQTQQEQKQQQSQSKPKRRKKKQRGKHKGVKVLREENALLRVENQQLLQQLNDVKKQLTQLKRAQRLDTAQYLQWSSDQLVDWIVSLEDGKYQQYENKFRTQFSKEGVNGEAIPHIDRVALNHWGIQNFMDRANLDNAIKRLVQQNKLQDNDVNDEGRKSYGRSPYTPGTRTSQKLCV
eukprot:1072706_1